MLKVIGVIVILGILITITVFIVNRNEVYNGSNDVETREIPIGATDTIYLYEDETGPFNTALCKFSINSSGATTPGIANLNPVINYAMTVDNVPDGIASIRILARYVTTSTGTDYPIPSGAMETLTSASVSPQVATLSHSWQSPALLNGGFLVYELKAYCLSGHVANLTVKIPI